MVKTLIHEVSLPNCDKSENSHFKKLSDMPEFSKKIKDVFFSLRIYTLRDLSQFSSRDLDMIAGIGKKSKAIIIACLLKNGLKLNPITRGLSYRLNQIKH
jgi:hypothetical protein